jgi:predicted DNA-binding antitoxin AbrB/MazE fold protein
VTISVDAVFQNGQLKLNEPVALAEGTPVRVTITPIAADNDPLADVIGIGDGLADGADNHDKYISQSPVL